MKTKQRNLRVFEIECDDAKAVGAYLVKNKALMDGLTVLLKGIKAKECVSFCEAEGLCYAVMGKCADEKQNAPKKAEKTAEQSNEAQNSQVIEKIVEKVVVQTVYVDRPSETVEPKSTKVTKHSSMRSGEDIVTNGDVAIFGRVNSGAKIKAEGSVEVFDTIDGLVECAGEYMLLKSIGKGTVVFSGNTLDAKKFDGKIKKVSIKDGVLEIKDI